MVDERVAHVVARVLARPEVYTYTAVMLASEIERLQARIEHLAQVIRDHDCDDCNAELDAMGLSRG